MPTLRCLSLLFFLKTALVLPAQTARFANVDAQAQRVNPAPNTAVPDLAQRLTADAATGTQKARAVYTWLTTHVAYNDTVITRGWLGTWENAVQQQPENVLRSRLAVCEGYANLMQALCSAAGLRTAVVSGQVKNADGYVPDVGHVWVAVEADGQWLLCDPTWGAGYTDARSRQFVPRPMAEWFAVPPLQFLTTHLPDDPVWQFSTSPITATQFHRLSTDELLQAAVAPNAAPFDYLDTIEHWFALDSTERMLVASRRVVQFNPGNDFALYHLGVYYYNLAVRDYYDLSHEIADRAYQPDVHPDSAYLLSRIDAVENNYRQAWHYFRYVQESALKKHINKLPTPEEQKGAHHYLRGMVRLWLVRDLASDFPLDDAALAKTRLQTIREQGEKGRASFAQAFATLDPTNRDLEFVWHNNLALLLYELAQSERTFATPNPEKDERQIRTQLDALDRAETLLTDLKSAMHLALAHRLPPAQGTVLDDYAGQMAGVSSDRGALHMSLVQAKYRSAFGTPIRVNLEQANDIVAQLDQCADHFATALRWATQDGDASHANRLRENIYNRDGYRHALMGDLLHAGAIEDYNAAINQPSILADLRPGLRTACDKAARHYTEARVLYEKAHADGANLRQLRERMKGLQEFKAVLK